MGYFADMRPYCLPSGTDITYPSMLCLPHCLSLFTRGRFVE
jgi:hypothetical protein